MTALVAQVTILRKGSLGRLRYVNGSMAKDTWRDPVTVSAGETFDEPDLTEAARLLATGAARLA